MERIRELNITLYIDTNKRTIRETFYSVAELISFIKQFNSDEGWNIDIDLEEE